MSKGAEWEIAISYTKNTVRFVVPIAIGRRLKENGYNRARVTLREDGILFMPYKDSSRPGTRTMTRIDLPWEDEHSPN